MLKGLTNWTVLNSKAVKAVAELVERQWGCGLLELLPGCGFLEGKDGDVFLISRDIEKLDLQQLRINSLGLYFGQLRNKELRLSIEGSQIIGKAATKNVVELNDGEFRQWLGGSELEKDYGSCTGYVIIKHGSDFVGCGKCKDGKMLNFVPKARRVIIRDGQA